VTDPRRLAARVLAEVETGRWSDEALGEALERSPLATADRALATRLVYGTLAWQRTLDHSIASYSARPIAKLDAEVVVALRLGLFQMGFLDRVPDHAAVATSVDLVAERASSAKGFVNALLRRAQREGLAPPPHSPETSYLGIALSHPDWLVRMWCEELGREETDALLEADNQAAPTCYRALGDRARLVDALREDGFDAVEAEYAKSAFYVAGPVLGIDGAVVQGEASQLVVEMLDPQPGETVLDACAAPGGKTAAIAGRVVSGELLAGDVRDLRADAPVAGARGNVVACDPSPRAAERLRAAISSAGLRDAVTFHGCRAEKLPPDADAFDRVLVDAPCSGLGTLRQHPEIRWRRTPDDLEDLAGRQRSILDAVAPRVKPGGTLVYSTCTIARTENDDVVTAFLSAHPGFERVPRDALPASLRPLCDDDGTLRTFPHRHDIDGFFAVRLRRKA
jgi:16S rRNA (cytosine967-C5)-methyltransferase